MYKKIVIRYLFSFQLNLNSKTMMNTSYILFDTYENHPCTENTIGQ